MKRHRRLFVLVGAVVLLATPSWAFFADDYLLTIISSVLQDIADVRMALQDTLTGNIHGIYTDVFPGSSDGLDGIFGIFQDINQVTGRLVTLRQELQRVSCGWILTARTLNLSNLFQPIHFCKPRFSVIFGGGGGYWDEDLEDFHDAVSSFALNTVSDSVNAEDGSWADIAYDIEYASKHVLKDPGWANRDEAVALAGADLMAEEQSKVNLARLIRKSSDRDYERFIQKKETDFSVGLVMGLVGEDLGGNPLPRGTE